MRRRLGLWLLLFGLATPAFAQFPNTGVKSVEIQNSSGTTLGTFTRAFTIKCGANFTTCSIAGTVLTLNPSGGVGGSTEIQVNAVDTTAQTPINFQNGTCVAVANPSAGNISVTFNCQLANTLASVAHKWLKSYSSASGNFTQTQPASTDIADFSTTAPATTGQIPIYDSTAANAAGGTGAYVPGDPLVQGTQAAGSTTIPNPVVIGGSDYSGTPTVRAAKVDAAGLLYIAPLTFSSPQHIIVDSGSIGVTNANLDVALSTRLKPADTLAGVTSVTQLNGAAVPTADYDSGAGTVTAPMVGFALPASGGPVAGGTSTNPIRTDPTGTTIQPVSGTVTTTPPTNASTNVAQVAGVAPAAVGAAISTDSVPLTIAGSDYAGTPLKRTFKVDSSGNIYAQATLAAETTKVIGTINIAASQTVGIAAGAAIIGKAGLDATTLGTTNGVTQYQLAATTANLTTTTCPGTGCLAVATVGYGVATVTVHGTYAGSTLNFEFSDDAGTTYFPLTCTRTDTAIQETSEAVATNATRAWDCGVYATSNLRVRQSAISSGTAAIGITLSAAAIEPAPTVALNNGSTTAVTQATAANLNATVVGNGTFAVQSTLQTQTDTTMVGGFNVKEINGVVPLMGNGVTGTGSPRVTVASDNTPFAVNSQPTPVTSGGLSTCYLTSAATTNATNCKNAAGQVYHVHFENTTGTLYFLRFYNLGAAPTCSSATGFVETVPVPASTTGAGITYDISQGQAYGTGIGFCLTGGGSSTDNTSAATGVYLTILYK